MEGPAPDTARPGMLTSRFAILTAAQQSRSATATLSSTSPGVAEQELDPRSEVEDEHALRVRRGGDPRREGAGESRRPRRRTCLDGSISPMGAVCRAANPDPRKARVGPERRRSITRPRAETTQLFGAAAQNCIRRSGTTVTRSVCGKRAVVRRADHRRKRVGAPQHVRAVEPDERRPTSGASACANLAGDAGRAAPDFDPVDREERRLAGDHVATRRSRATPGRRRATAALGRTGEPISRV